MGILVKNSDFALLWGEPYPEITFDNSTYSLAGEEGTELEATFSITDNNSEDVTDQCTITFNNEYVTIDEEGKFVCEGLEVGTYETTVTATYSYKSATVTTTATINISVTEIQPTSISFGSESYTMNGNEYAALSTQFSVSDNLGNDVTALSSYSFEPNDKGLYADGGYFKVDSATAGIYSITVTATYGSLTNTATISMAVVDYPDSISFDSNSYSMSGTEGDTITQSFTVTDDLSHDVTSNCSFSLSPNNTGLTASNGTFDASAVAEGTYSVTVTATYQSGNGRTLTATATVAMEIASASHDYSQDYLTFEALESGTITLKIPSQVNSTKMTSVSYSTDNGATWVDTTVDNTYQTITTPTIAQGDKVLWKGIGTIMSAGGDTTSCFFSISNSFNVSGNIMSLLYGDNFQNQTSFPSGSTYNFGYLFYNSGNRLVSVENLVLPATTLAEECYASMFQGCTALTTAPALPATTLVTGCYFSMFSGCTSLTTPPALPATTLALICYKNMFNGCTSLTTAPSNLLPATTLANQCYTSMFQGCTSLTTAPALPATTMTTQCYMRMFYNCTSLTTPPTLPATTLAQTCYQELFSGCTALTTAPVLPATTLAVACYQRLFHGCTNLSSITMLATDISAANCMLQWVNGVAASGTFTKDASQTSLPTATSSNDYQGIPENWTVVDAQ